MATYQLAPEQGEYLVQCPYNKSHQILNTRELTHLDKCRRAYKKEMANLGKPVEIVACKFNFSHQYPKIELNYHHSHCPDQHRVVEHIKYHESEMFNEMKSKYDESRQQTSKGQVDEEEDWDTDSIGQDYKKYKAGYDPSQKLNTDNILYMPRGLSKSERKAYRREQTRKCREAESTPNSSNQSHMATVGEIEKELSNKS